MIVDAQGRRFRNLRVSLTAACNYACTYCVPNGKRLMKARNELDAGQLLRAVRLLVDAVGIDKLRITGGEPLVSPKIGAFVDGVMQLPLRDVSLTTNGQLLERHVDAFARAGIRRLNVSLDTLDPVRFRQIARGGDLASVLGGIAAAQRAGIRIRINMVPMRTSNIDQILPLLAWCLERGIELRFIELMRMGHLAHSAQFGIDFIGMAEILDLIGSRWEFERTDAPYDSTSVRFAIPGSGTFGIIPNESEPFCRSCTRLRLSSDGRVYGCLSSTRSHSIAELLDRPDDEAIAGLQAVLGLALADKQPVAFRGEVTVMKLIGG